MPLISFKLLLKSFEFEPVNKILNIPFVLLRVVKIEKEKTIRDNIFVCRYNVLVSCK